MSYRKRYSTDELTDSSDESEHQMRGTNSSNVSSTQSQTQSSNHGNTVVNINEVLQRALERAANPGIGDEEPEILKDPEHEARGGGTKKIVKEDEQENSEEQKFREREEEKLRLLCEEERRVAEMSFDPNAIIQNRSNMRERSKYIPLRLTYEERKTLRLVNASINVSDYTNVVDIPFKNNARRQHVQLQQVVAFLSGLIAAIDYIKGQEVLVDRNFVPYEQNIQDMLEIARRYKITNPEKMRSEYGKLIYLMQDAESEEMKPLLGVNIHKPIKTVYSLLEETNTLALLDDELIATATEEILPSKDKNRSYVQMEIKRKEKAVEKIVKQYASSRLHPDMIRQCLYSISDNNSFLNSNKKPVEDCIQLLQEYFKPTISEEGYSLSINEETIESKVGSRLTHSHETQYHYVHQSLALWSAILEDMFRLWYLSEQDLLNEKAESYDLRHTGQGLQRVQPSPRVYRAMHEILNSTKQKLGNWVGSSVIHLGDNNVPNALIFIDKYTQVARILGPLVKTLANIETACEENEGLMRYIKAYGGLKKAKKDILHDFFRYAFDGSGGFNDFDAGSCIDGRLTSAWNWCSQLSSKPYYPLFRLTGFLSFDGEFDK